MQNKQTILKIVSLQTDISNCSPTLCSYKLQVILIIIFFYTACTLCRGIHNTQGSENSYVQIDQFLNNNIGIFQIWTQKAPQQRIQNNRIVYQKLLPINIQKEYLKHFGNYGFYQLLFDQVQSIMDTKVTMPVIYHSPQFFSNLFFFTKYEIPKNQCNRGHMKHNRNI